MAYDFDNTPPTAIALASSTPDNTAPVAIALASSSPDNTAPTAIALASSTPDNTEPTAIALASSTPDNTAPGGITLASQTPDNTAPAGIAIASEAPSNEAARPRYKTTITIGRPNNDTVNTPILKAEGALVLNQLFGQTRIPLGCGLTRMQLALEEAPTGGPVTVILVNAAGVAYAGATVTVADGATFGETIFTTPIPFVAEDDVRAKPTVIGLTLPGGFGTLTLFTQLT